MLKKGTNTNAAASRALKCCCFMILFFTVKKSACYKAIVTANLSLNVAPAMLLPVNHRLMQILH
jgi:hypothetical protein